MNQTRERQLEVLLSEGLDLCIRARQMDSMDRRAATLAASCDPDWEKSGLFDKHVEYHNQHMPDRPISTRSATVRLWIEEQYQTDLADWERRARDFLFPPGTRFAARTALEQEDGK